MFSLAGKKAIVTGGARGLCNSMAQALHGAGAEVALIDINQEALAAAAREIGKKGAPVHCVQGDLSDLERLSAVYDTALSQLEGRLDILVNSAGIQFGCAAEDFPLDRWQSVIGINLSAVFALSQLAGQTMLEQGSRRIINIASMTSFFGSEMVSAYAASAYISGAILPVDGGYLGK